ncbi:hypothetical protein [Streptomyces mashuensis]|nr:hypothetical protein [Streptomyces mashuensis]
MPATQAMPVAPPLPPAAPATAPGLPAMPPPPGAPPAPGYAPGYAPPGYAPGAPVPTPASLFFRRVVAGDWQGAAKAALWPLGLFLVLALLLSLPWSDDYDEIGLGDWSDRFPVAVALLLQGLGAGLDFETTREGGGLITLLFSGRGSLSVLPLTITLLWAGALAVGARRLRRQPGPVTGGTGADAVVRIALLCGAGTLLLGFLGDLDLQVVKVSLSPFLAALCAALLAAAVSGAVLYREALCARWGAGALMLTRAWGTALRALGMMTALCALVVLIVFACSDDADGSSFLTLLPLLVNAGLVALGVSWGASSEVSTTSGEGRSTYDSFGLARLGEEAGGWAQAGAVVLGVVCAVLLAVTIARRSADRREQVLSGLFFLVVLCLLALVSGVEWEMTAGTSFSYRTRTVTTSAGTNAGELLLFGLLWTAGAVGLAVLLGRTGLMGGGPGGGGAGGGHVPPMPGFAPGAAPGTTASVTTASGALLGAPAMPPAPPGTAATRTRKPAAAPLGGRRPMAWLGLGAAVLLVGGAAVGGVVLTHGDKHDESKGDKVVTDPTPDDMPPPGLPTPSTSPSATPEPTAPPTTATPEASPSAEDPAVPFGDEVPGDPGADGDGTTGSPEPSASASPERTRTPEPKPSGTADKPEKLPAGYEMKSDPKGFRIAVPEGWKRSPGETQVDYKPAKGNGLLRIGVLPKAKDRSYDNFLKLEGGKDGVAKRNGYKRISLERATIHGRPGARWEYTWKDASGRTLHAIDEAYVTESGTEYAVYFRSTDADWKKDRKTFDTAVAHAEFR